MTNNQLVGPLIQRKIGWDMCRYVREYRSKIPMYYLNLFSLSPHHSTLLKDLKINANACVTYVSYVCIVCIVCIVQLFVFIDFLKIGYVFVRRLNSLFICSTHMEWDGMGQDLLYDILYSCTLIFNYYIATLLTTLKLNNKIK